MKHLFILFCLLASGFASNLVSEEESTDTGITCDPKTPCWICEPTLREKGRMWCKEHDRYEDRCWLCHPEMQDKKRLYCKEHGVYEDECSICHPPAEEKVSDKKSAAKPACTSCPSDHPVKPAPKATDKNAGAHQADKPVDAGPPCKAHGIPESVCFVCNPKARQKGRLWCKEHARYEDRCWLCHPELKEEKREYCEEHFLYEDECIYCNPKLLKGDSKDGHSHVDPKPGKRLYCKEHAVYEDECAICHPDLAPSLIPGEELKIRFSSSESAKKAGVATKQPQPIQGAASRKAYAEIAYNKNRLTHITPLAGGVVTKVFVEAGDTVQAGDILLELSSTDIAKAKQLYLSARLEKALAEKEHQRQQALRKDKISAERDVQHAEAALARSDLSSSAAKQALINLGFDQKAVQHIATTRNTDTTLTVRAPFSGTIIDRSAVQGAAVEPGTSLMQLADLSHMWIELSVPEKSLSDLKVGQAVSVTFSALGDEVITGTLNWIASNVDQRSRMVRARAVVPNKKGLLRAGLFGNATIVTSANTKGLGIPSAALQHLEQEPFVFVRQADDLYVARRIGLGHKLGDRYLVQSGITTEDHIVVAGTHVVFSEMMKSRLGAGCVDD